MHDIAVVIWVFQLKYLYHQFDVEIDKIKYTNRVREREREREREKEREWKTRASLSVLSILDCV